MNDDDVYIETGSELEYYGKMTRDDWKSSSIVELLLLLMILLWLLSLMLLYTESMFKVGPFIESRKTVKTDQSLETTNNLSSKKDQGREKGFQHKENVMVMLYINLSILFLILFQYQHSMLLSSIYIHT